MSRTSDHITDELTNAITARIDACCSANRGVEVLIDGIRMHSASDAFCTLLEREFWSMTQRGLRPAVRQQVIRNVEAWVRYGPPSGGIEPEEAAS